MSLMDKIYAALTCATEEIEEAIKKSAHENDFDVYCAGCGEPLEYNSGFNRGTIFVGVRPCEKCAKKGEKE